MSEFRSETRFSVKTIAVTGLLLALGFVLSYIRLFHMPTGGSVTLFSMLAITSIGYFFGPFTGLIGGLLYGLLQFLQNPEILSPLQVIFDYFLSFSALGLSGILHRKKFGLPLGYLLGIFARFLFASLASYLFWGEYLDADTAPFIAACIYNGAYIGTEGLITLIILFLPPVRKLFLFLKRKL